MADRHTFIGKRKVGNTDICDFTDYQGIGCDPLYKRYESVFSIVKRSVSPQYAHFLAAPAYSASDDAINWYIDEWSETPEVLSGLQGRKKEKYQRIKDETVAQYKQSLNNLSGEDLKVMAYALRYINDDFIFCCDDKVFVVAWGMTPDTRKHISTGELVHEAPSVTKYMLTFDIGEHGLLSAKASNVVCLQQGTEISVNDIPQVFANDGYTFNGWDTDPVGMVVNSDMTFVAQYSKIAAPLPPPPVDAVCRFDAGENGVLNGEAVITRPIGSQLFEADIPQVTPKKGFFFKGWDVNPLNALINGDVVYHALYEPKLPWYKKFWLWLTGKGCLKWLLSALLAILLLLLFAWLFKDCHGCSRETNGVVELDRKINADGDTIDNNGVVRPIDLEDGKLPEDGAIVAPIIDEDGEEPPIKRDPGVPAVIANRLFIFLEDKNDNIDAFAADFKKAYPGDKYNIIGFDRDVKSLLIQIPENERDEIRKSLNSKIPNHKFIVFDEEIYELNRHTSSSTDATRGWHLNAVKARDGWAITKGDPSVTVAVVDDGIDASHAMFKNRITNAYNVFTQNNRLSKGGGHGTHTAGLAVGSLEFLRQGAAGIAPECMLMPVQVIDNEKCPLSALVSGIMYAIHKGADVVNISIGPSFQGLNQLPVDLQNKIAKTQFKNVERLWNRVCRIAAEKNTILVFAAGNDDILSSIPPENRTSVAITVGSVDQKLYPTDFTNYGPCTDISAPGKEIYSSFPVNSFNSCDGTSMSAPIVTGTIALMKSLKRSLTVEQARNVLYKTGRDVYGNMPPMVQVNRALEAVKRGDFSAPDRREVRPVPADAIDAADGDTPASWTQPITDVVIVDTDGEIAIGDSEGVPPTDTIAVRPAPGRPAPSRPAPGESAITPPSNNNESDYDAIRRLIAIYKQKISELEGQLPEKKRK